MTAPALILGAGGHARVLLDALRLLGAEVMGLVDRDPTLHGADVLGATVIGSEAVVDDLAPRAVELVNGLGSLAPGGARGALYARFKARGFAFRAVIHPTAIIARGGVFGEGLQVMAGAVVQVGCVLGSNVLINTRAVVDHDCAIGDDVHIAPGATLSGGVRVGDGSHLGTGATVIQGIRIGRGCLVAAGAVVVEDVPDGAQVRGVPARRFP